MGAVLQEAIGHYKALMTQHHEELGKYCILILVKKSMVVVL